MSTEANKAIVMRAIDEGFNGGDLGVADEIFTDDYTVHAPGLDLPRGPGAFKNAIGMWRTAFPDIHMDVQQLYADGDFVINRFVTQGTHGGNLFGFAPTGKPMTIRGMEIHQVVEGKVVASWIGDDVPSILMQLGLLTPGPQ
ncbi:MAG TPA: ester cyclase [Acidimicrobiales bacterium]|jgi:predicted ester cyclase|nr:ester cyclase [Acidimicrobiales bacterium]